VRTRLHVRRFLLQPRRSVRVQSITLWEDDYKNKPSFDGVKDRSLAAELVCRLVARGT
jgi:hypothetical protein